MLNYQLTDSQDKHFYTCLPEVIIYSIQSKETVLFSSYAAQIIHVLSSSFKGERIPFSDLSKQCDNGEHFSPETFEQSLEQLLQMNIIESIEC